MRRPTEGESQALLKYPPWDKRVRELVDRLESEAGRFFRNHMEEVDDCLAPAVRHSCALTHKFDLTFRCDVSAKCAHRQVTRWLRDFRRDRHFFAMFVIAETRLSKRAHVHGFCAFPYVPMPKPRFMKDSFSAKGGVNGFAQVEEYDFEKGRGGLKYMLNHGWPDIHVFCPRKRRCNKGRCGAPKTDAGDARLHLARDRGDLFRR